MIYNNDISSLTDELIKEVSSIKKAEVKEEVAENQEKKVEKEVEIEKEEGVVTDKETKVGSQLNKLAFELREKMKDLDDLTYEDVANYIKRYE
ncbi:MAG: hypothetical protein ACTSPI_00140 [Candidatus Heimdallarchaeaceae archaeon]